MHLFYCMLPSKLHHIIFLMYSVDYIKGNSCSTFAEKAKLQIRAFNSTVPISWQTLTVSFILQMKNEPVRVISNNVVCATSKSSDQPAHTRSLIRAFASRLSIL